MSARSLLDPALYALREEHRAYAALRTQGPVFAMGDGAWAVLGHRETREVLTQPRVYSSALGTRPGLKKLASAPAAMNQLDPPEHTQLRSLANSLLDRAARARVSLGSSSDARRIIAQLAERGTGELIADVAQPLASMALARWLGLEDAEREACVAALARSHAAGSARLDPTQPVETLARRTDEALAAKNALHALCERWIERATSGALAALRRYVERGQLEAARARGLAVLFVEAGYVTARDAIANTLTGCAEDPRRTRWLCARAGERTSIARFVEESLRLDPPLVQFARTLTGPAILGGASLREGDRAVVFFAAANRDPSLYSQPDRFVPARRGPPHLAFGAGPHACIGASLARTQLRAVCSALATHVSALELDGAPVRRASNYLAGFERVAVRVRARVTRRS